MRITREPLLLSIALLLAVLGGTGFKSSGKAADVATDSSVDARVLAPGARVGNESFAALTVRWWQWAKSMPLPPYLDPDGSLCTQGQRGDVWFLAGTNGQFEPTRRCVVPSGKHLLLPVINMIHHNPYPGSGYAGRSCAALQAAAAVNNDALRSAVVLIDDTPVAQVQQYRVLSDGCFPLHPGDQESPIAAADGYWLLLKPLPDGRHTIRVGANYGAADSGYGQMRQNFEYVLDVGGVVNVAAR